MEHTRAYGQDALFTFPLLDGGATEDFEATPVTIAAGDVKVWTDKQIAANPTAETVAFTSGGTTVPTLGETITGATSTETCTLMFYIVTSGTWAGGDAAGVLFVKSASGAFQSENLNGSASGSNFATIGGDLDGAGLFKHIGEGMYCLALTAAEMSCQQGWVTIKDATATEEWADTALTFSTFGHESALDPQGCVYTADLDATDDGEQTTTLISMTTLAPTVTLRAGYYFEVTGGTGEGQAGYVKTYSSYQVVPYVTLDTALDNTSTVKFYRDAKRAPVHLVAGESSAITADVLAGDCITNAKIADDALDTEQFADGALTAAKFVEADPVPVNVVEINDTAVTGDGGTTTSWGPA